MKFLFTLLISSMLINPSCHKDFKFESATSQKWHAGVRQGGYGTYYKIYLIANKSNDILQFDKLWVDDKALPVSVHQPGKKIRNGVFNKGNKIEVSATSRTVPPEEREFKEGDKIPDRKKKLPPESKTEENPLPEKYKGKTVLEYTVKNKKKYFEIKEFSALKAVYYP